MSEESLFTVPFGRFKGQDVEDLPSWYLRYLTEQDWFVRKYPQGLDGINKKLEYRDRFGHPEK